jgi:hypothetical protein
LAAWAQDGDDPAPSDDGREPARPGNGVGVSALGEEHRSGVPAEPKAFTTLAGVKSEVAMLQEERGNMRGNPPGGAAGKGVLAEVQGWFGHEVGSV